MFDPAKIPTFDSKISAKSNPLSKILEHVNQRLRWVSLAREKLRGKNLGTLSL